MNRIELQELVRERQVGNVNRRDFLIRATAVLGSAAAASTLLAACTPVAGPTPPPVVDATQPPPEPGLSAAGELQTGDEPAAVLQVIRTAAVCPPPDVRRPLGRRGKHSAGPS